VIYKSFCRPYKRFTLRYILPMYTEEVSGGTRMGLFRAGALFFIITGLFAASAFSQDTEYRIQSGDTLYSIARRYEQNLSALMEYNGIEDATELRIGQIIRIPGAAAASGAAEASVDYPLEDYEIRVGDTLYAISRRTGMSLDELRTVNKLKDAVIVPGQIIRVRALPAVTDPPDPASQQTVASETRTAREGTILTSRPSAGGEEQYWPHDGERFEFNGKFPGIVIRGSAGDDIHAVSDGRVVYSGPHSTLGKVVFVQNSRGYIFIYGGSRELFVDQGDEVASGQVIGSLGASPLMSEVQVYFSVWKEGRYLDPNTVPR
jgi:murein DD-endopeptidase MepM/ murein hydrolase activator NlpD